MKKLVFLMLILLLCAAMLPAYAAGSELSWQRAVDMAQHMRQIASGDYLAINGVPESLQRTARGWAAGVEGEPRMIVRLDVENAAFVRNMRAYFANEHPMVSFEAESTVMMEVVSYAMVYAAYESVVGAVEYEEILEVNGLLNCSMIYAEEAPAGTAYYLVLYEDAQPILILASAENNAVCLTGWFIPSKQLADCASSGQVSLWFLKNGMPMTCREIFPE